MLGVVAGQGVEIQYQAQLARRARIEEEFEREQRQGGGETRVLPRGGRGEAARQVIVFD